MRRLLLAMLVQVALGASALADPSEEALRVVDEWGKAFVQSDVDGILKLYAPDALFFGTGSQVLVSTPEGIRKYFEQALLTNRPKSAVLRDRSVVALTETTVVVAGLDSAGGVRDGKSYSADGRVTFVLAKRGNGWQIVHFHRSAVPN